MQVLRNDAKALEMVPAIPANANQPQQMNRTDVPGIAIGLVRVSPIEPTSAANIYGASNPWQGGRTPI